MEFTLFAFKSSKPKQKTVAQKNKEFWLNELQLLFSADGNEVVYVRGKDIECVWTEGNGHPMRKTVDGETVSNPDYKTIYLIRTRSGQTFCLTRGSWIKCRYENAEEKED